MADYWVDKTNGSDGTGDGSSGNPWATLNYALTTGGATGGDTVHVANTSAQTGAVSFASVTTSGTAPLRIVPWDNGGAITADVLGEQVVAFEMDGQSSTAQAFTTSKNYICIQGAKIHGYTSSAINGVGSYWTMVDCEIYGNGARGIYNIGNLLLIRCHIHDNATEGVWFGANGIAIDCASIDNNYHGFRAPLALINCVVSRITNTAGAGMSGSGSIAYRCSFMGGAAGGVIGVEGYLLSNAVIGCVFSDFNGTGDIPIATNGAGFITHGWNSRHNCNADAITYEGLDLSAHDVSESATQFEDAANDDYRIVSGANAKGAGVKGPTKNAPAVDMGAIPAGSGGGSPAIVRGAITFGG